MNDKIKKEEREQAYNPDFFVSDLTNLISLFFEKTKVIEEIEFTMAQRAQIAGLIMGASASFMKFNNLLKKWGFLVEGG